MKLWEIYWEVDSYEEHPRHELVVSEQAPSYEQIVKFALARENEDYEEDDQYSADYITDYSSWEVKVVVELETEKRYEIGLLPEFIL